SVPTTSMPTPRNGRRTVSSNALLTSGMLWNSHPFPTSVAVADLGEIYAGEGWDAAPGVESVSTLLVFLLRLITSANAARASANGKRGGPDNATRYQHSRRDDGRRPDEPRGARRWLQRRSSRPQLAAPSGSLAVATGGRHLFTLVSPQRTWNLSADLCASKNTRSLEVIAAG